MQAAKTIAVGKMKRVMLRLHVAISAVVILLALLLFIYPAATICLVVADGQLKRTGQSWLVPHWFDAATGRFLSWAGGYLETNYAASLHHDDIPATEWPMFGAAFYLLIAEELHSQGKIDITKDNIRRAIDKAAEIVASPATGTWVKTKWGDGYLQKENVFYRMLFIMGLASYEKLTGNTRFHAMMAGQRDALDEELALAKYNLRDDYPGECYPADMLWAVAAIQRAARFDGVNHDKLVKNLMAVFDDKLKSPSGLPAFQADSRTGRIIQDARGCGNSGLLVFAYESDPRVAGRWYDAYAENFWKDTGWIAGFTEMPIASADSFADVDSGPVLCGVGSVASAFGIGAAKTAGRIDHAAPLTMEAVACSWPTPFGFLVPGLMGRLAAGSWSLGEVALLFSMTRPTLADKTVSFTGHVPSIVWVMLFFYAGSGLFLIWYEIRCIRRRIHKYQQPVSMVVNEPIQGGEVDMTPSPPIALPLRPA